MSKQITAIVISQLVAVGITKIVTIFEQDFPQLIFIFVWIAVFIFSLLLFWRLYDTVTNWLRKWNRQQILEVPNNLRNRLLEASAVLLNWISTVLPALAIVIIVLALLLTPTILVLTGHLETGFGNKTLWQWLEVVGIPLTVVIIAGIFGLAAQRAGRRAEEQRERDADRAREATLRAYLDDMTKLILEHKLQDSEVGSAERAVAHAQTFMALRTLDGPRKGVLLQFLKDSQLINKDKPIISLHFADLTYANLSSADLHGTDLSSVNLRYADLRNADLRDTDLSEAVVTPEQLDSAKDTTGALLPRRIDTTS